MNFTRNKKILGRKSLHLFEMVFNSLIISILGIFTTLALIFTSLSVIFFVPEYNQTIFFCILGVIVFLISYRLFLRYNGHHLRNLDYQHFVIARKKVVSWFLWTLSTYFLCVWFFLLLMGTTNGFYITFPTKDQKPALISSSAEDTKLISIILLSVHAFLIIVFRIISFYWMRIATFAYREFEKRRKLLEIVRTKANIK